MEQYILGILNSCCSRALVAARASCLRHGNKHTRRISYDTHGLCYIIEFKVDYQRGYFSQQTASFHSDSATAVWA